MEKCAHISRVWLFFVFVYKPMAKEFLFGMGFAFLFCDA